MNSGALFLRAVDRDVLSAVVDRVAPAGAGYPGASALGAVEYIDRALGAFETDPPMIWAGGPFSGRRGGAGGFGHFEELSAREELAWRTRIEGSRGRPEREWNGPVRGWQEIYRDGVDSLGDDFVALSAERQDERLEAAPTEFKHLVHEHVCEACYGPPEYGGNVDALGWVAIGWPGDTQPRGWTDEEVRGRE